MTQLELSQHEKQPPAQEPDNPAFFLEAINKLMNSQKPEPTDESIKREIIMLREQILSIQKQPDNMDKIKEQGNIIAELQKVISG